MRLNDQVLDLALAAGMPLALHGLAGVAARTVGDDHGLRPFLHRLVPWMTAAALEVAMLRASGLAIHFDLRRVWMADAVWHVDVNGLAAQWLVPERLLAMAASSGPAFGGSDRVTSYALALAAAGFATSLWLERLTRRGLTPRHLLPLALQVLAAVATLHLLLVTAFWLMHWLNFWLLFLVLLFVELRRREGDGSKYQAS